MRIIYLTGLLLLVCFVPTFPQAVDETDLEITNQTVDLEETFSHIWFLASDELKGRNTGSTEIDIAASYIASRLRSFGVKSVFESGSYFQNIPLESISSPAISEFSIESSSFEVGKNLIVLHPGIIDQEAPIQFVDYGTPEELKKYDLKGKIIVTRAGNANTTNPRQFFGISVQKRAAATSAGALALVEIYDAPSLPWSTLENYFNREQIRPIADTKESESIPHAWLYDPASSISEMVNAGNLSMTGYMKMEAQQKKIITSKNIIGIIPGSDPVLKDQYVLLSAHYDHIGFKTGTNGEDSIFNGARDNAVGTAAILAAAKSLSTHPPKRSILFLACTGEEKGLLGSRFFAENPPLPLHQIVFNLNSDGGGYNDTTKVSIMGLNRTTAQQAITSSCKDFGLGTIADPAPEQNLFDRSDNVVFARLGIPAPTFSTGFTSFNQEILTYYHQVTDNPETLDYKYLSKFIKAFVLTARRVANMNEAPFWIEGDKYESAGKDLYKK